MPDPAVDSLQTRLTKGTPALMSAWIKMLSDEEADEDLLAALKLARTPHGTVDNVMRVHSLRPNTLRGHVALYRAALHDDANTLPLWLQETIASYVSMLNDCPYSLANHWANARHLIGDEKRADAIEAALKADRPEQAFEGPRNWNCCATPASSPGLRPR